MTIEERKEYMKKWREEHREERKEYMKKWNADHREEHRKYYAEHREEYIENMKNRYAEHREEYKAKTKKWRTEHREEYNARIRRYQSEDMNTNGVTKNSIRTKSNIILKKCHAKLPGYEIHHCFGYEDPSKFIYIPRELHIKIHQLLKDNKIPSDTNHWKNIAEIVNECENYTYIRT